MVARAALPIAGLGDFEIARVTPDHRLLVATEPDQTTVWRLDTDTLAATVPFGASGQALAVSLDGALAATSGHEEPGPGPSSIMGEALRLWSLPDLSEIRCWRLADLGCRDIACALAFAADGRHLVVAGWDGVLRRIALA